MTIKDLTLRYIGDFSPGTGYNMAMRGYLRCLQYLGLDAGSIRGMAAVAFAPGADTSIKEDWTFNYLRGDWDEDPPINVVHSHLADMGNYYTSGKYNIGIAVWETDKLPVSVFQYMSFAGTVVEMMNKFDEIWVPTRWLRKLLVKDGVTAPGMVIPHCLPPELTQLYPYEDRVLETDNELGVERTEVRFYSIGTWNPRKNMEQLFQAYLMTGWSPVDGVDL
ncbi:MAG: hypothetical protein JRD89_15555, partial [Deltaproteobacteria bacterium]|nr:hypothetical protein [Deltaproteobacteria bacterium]